MTDIVNALDSMVSQADWARMAEQAGVGRNELKSKVEKAMVAYLEGAFVKTDGGGAGRLSSLKLGDVSADGHCHTQEFEISLYEIIGLSGELTLCGTSMDDFKAELKACLIVAGAKVWCVSYTFDPHNLGVCFSPDVGVAKAELCFHLRPRGNTLCFAISGKACIWSLWWRCEEFDETLFCIPL